LLLIYGSFQDGRGYISHVLASGTHPAAFDDASAAQVGRLTSGVCLGQLRGLRRSTRAVACGLWTSMRSLRARWMLRVWYKVTSETHVAQKD
jgi:hypothetical protein